MRWRGEMIRAIAAKGGVVFINFHAGYLNQSALDVYERNKADRDRDLAAMWALHRDDPNRFELDLAIRARYAKKMPPVSYEAILEHIDHIVKLVGPDHVGFGSDFDGISAMVPEGMARGDGSAKDLSPHSWEERWTVESDLLGLGTAS